MPKKLIKCKDCQYHTGNPGGTQKDLICAVNIPQPSLAELERVDGRTASALHSCYDFEAKNP